MHRLLPIASITRGLAGVVGTPDCTGITFESKAGVAGRTTARSSLQRQENTSAKVPGSTCIKELS